MVAPTSFNLQNLRGRTFEGFVQFQIPTTTIPPTGVGAWFRMKERQTMQFKMQWNRAEHYDDAGLKAVDPAGHSHTFTMTLKTTTDMFDATFGESADNKTLTYWIYRNSINAPIQVIFVTSLITLDPNSNDTINLKFVLDPTTFSTGLGASGGSPDITVSGTVISITSALKASNEDQPTS